MTIEENNTEPTTAGRIAIVKRILIAMVPEIKDTFSYMNKQGGWFAVNDRTLLLIKNLRLQWWNYYEDEKKARVLGLLMQFTPEQLEEIKSREQIYQEMEPVIDVLKLPDEKVCLKESDFKDLAAIFEKAPPEEKQAIIQLAHVYWTGFFCQFFNTFAAMIHGRSMCRLVADAIAGDDQALCLAVQIDRMVLNLPYFKERWLRFFRR